ncbi:hypothetical protein L226DRAFT_452550 [Lentinus tigrinus ALCF2SS1-7]|uniref:SAP domain-containing protein n=1 Tax=Lentinus tigrinus ALCF2SS1-6 TaxID=1328759 RepID=A0A5C2STL6_9APHY|nr:hypothetical protein L227DRAFT_491165 [Lentinus tigrinus ALCF2SS1-6]RPD81187.1 hypothetical protein L226DRAFT_452550 [Lentinus tigrinus ALCF2SS1-7]
MRPIARHFSRQSRQLKPLFLAHHVTALMLHLFYGLSHRASGLLLKCLRFLVQVAYTSATGGGVSPEDSATLDRLPIDIRTIVSRFDLDPHLRSFVCCPVCFAIYDTRPLPGTCLHRPTPKSDPCGAQLWRSRNIRGKTFSYPLRTYLHQELKEWLARFLARPGMEDVMDSAAGGVTGFPKRVMRDLWDAPVFRELLKDGHPFVLGPPGEGRYVFALYIDSFNPFQNKEAKQNENSLLIGIIPGPHKPSLDQLNHYLKVLVDELLVFWDTGVYFSRTAKYEAGRLVRCALVPLVCDLPAARQAGGFGGYKAKYFCSMCKLPYVDINNLDQSTWEARSCEEHKELARVWRDLPSTWAREKAFGANSIRWSELMRLPYWDPIKYTVIDSMHNHYLGLLKWHCRKIWGMSLEIEDSSGGVEPLKPEEEDLSSGISVVYTGTDEEVASLPRNILRLARANAASTLTGRYNLAVLRAVCNHYQLSNDGTRLEMAQRLIHHQHNPQAPEAAELSPQAETVKSVLGRQTLAEIHEQLPLTELPSWVNPVPHNVGTTERGKLSADQWHVLCVVNLPIILIRLWTPMGGVFKAWLDNFMHLVTAVVIGGLLEMSEEAVAEYENAAHSYLVTARELYDITLTPNQHNALHISFFMRYFGPLHAIRTFFSERNNLLIQSTETNGKFGELELTFTRHYNRVSQLKVVLADESVRPHVEEMLRAYQELQGEDRRGTRLRESIGLGDSQDRVPPSRKDGKPVELDNDCLTALVRFLNQQAGREAFIDAREIRRVPGTTQLLNRATQLRSIQVHGVSFTSERDSSKDSNVVFNPPGSDTWSAGRIQRIFSFSYRDNQHRIVEGTYLFIKPYESLSPADAEHDYYRKYRFVGGRLFYAQHGAGVIVTADHVVSHFARTPMRVPPISAPCMHVLPLDKVCLP